MLVPLYGFVEGDTIGLLVLAHESMSIADVADKLRTSARVRIDPSGRWKLLAGDRILDPTLTVSTAGLAALDRIDLRREEDAGG